MRISQQLVEEVVAHARADEPNECCGLIGGVNGVAASVHRVVNAEASPLRFEMDAQEQINALNAIEAAGQELLAIYHSHTKTAARPSQTDVNLAKLWPDPIWVIVSLENPDRPDVKGFWIRKGAISDAELRIE